MSFAEQAVTQAEQRSLAARIQKGDPFAEDELARLYAARVLVMLISRTGDRDAARDLCQDVMIALLHALRDGQLRDSERLSAFVHGIARNTANNYVRTRHRLPCLAELSESLATACTDDPAESAERRQFVNRALASVPSTDRRILTLTLVDGLKPAEIAAHLGLNGEVVRARKSRALRKVIEVRQGLVTNMSDRTTTPVDSMSCDEIAAHAVAERYLLAGLSEPDRDAYERHYFSCERCFHELTTVGAVRTELNAAGLDDHRLIAGFAANVVAGLAGCGGSSS